MLVDSYYRLFFTAEMAWVEPSDEEKQLMAERRRTRDQISSQMGQYLLKGYKMLDKTCGTCGVSQREYIKSNREYCGGVYTWEQVLFHYPQVVRDS